MDSKLIEVKSKFGAEFRRWGFVPCAPPKFDEFFAFIEKLHKLPNNQFLISYVDPTDNDLLPINNDDNFGRALKTAKPLLRIIVHRKDEVLEDSSGYGTMKNRPNNMLSGILGQAAKPKGITISNPKNFRQVSAIIDTDTVPFTCRRVRLMKHGSDRPLGFYIKEGQTIRCTENGLEKTNSIFISRLIAGGIAESTGLLAVDDEVLEVNGIEVAGKTLDQVTDMMVANSENLIITVRPFNQKTLPSPKRGSSSRNSCQSITSHKTNSSGTSNEMEDNDEIVDMVGLTLEENNSNSETILTNRSEDIVMYL